MTNKLHNVEAERAEAIRRYNNVRIFSNILQAATIVLLCYFWFPTTTNSLGAIVVWFKRTGLVIITNRSVVFVFTNILVALILRMSKDSNNESNIEQDLYDQYTSSVVVTASAAEVGENKRIVHVFITEGKEEEVVVETETDVKASFRRTKSEIKKKSIFRPEAKEYRRTESAKVMPMERLSSEEFRLKVERFIMEKKMRLVQEEDDVVVQATCTW